MAEAIKLANIVRGSKTQVLQSGKLPDTPIEKIDQYLKGLKEKQLIWSQSYPLEKKIQLLEQVLVNLEKYKEEWAIEDMKARHIPKGHFSEGESHLGGPGAAASGTHVYIEILKKIATDGPNKPFSTIHQKGDRVVVDTYPLNLLDKIKMPGVKAEVHLQLGTKIEDYDKLQALSYKDKYHPGGISLILGAGNVSGLTVTDIYHKLFVEKKVTIVKAHPVLEYMGPLLEKVFEPFIKEGFLKIVQGGAKEGHHLVTHPLVDDIHMTGSDKTFETIVYGGGEEGRKNKAADHRINNKPVTAELGNVTPVIVVPGDWNEADFDYQAKNIFSMMAIFNGYTCTTMRVLILPKGWDGSAKLVKKLEDIMADMTPAVNYYPGTGQTFSDAMSCYPGASVFGKLDEDRQPWMLVKNLDAKDDETAYNREFWASFTTQTYLEGKTKEEYLENAVKFANEKLWGTLSVAIVIDTKTQKELTDSGVLDKVIDDLHYGTVAFNVYPGFSMQAEGNPWGGYPGATYNNIQSGNSFVHNPYMLEKVEKSVFFMPFRMGKEPFATIRKEAKPDLAKAMVNYSISHKFTDFAKLLFTVMRQ